MKRYLKCLTVLMTICLTATFCGCNQAEYQQDDEYVASVKQLVNDSVKYTRIWKEQDDDFNCHDVASTKEYLETLDELIDIYQQLLLLQPTNKFDDNDQTMKSNAQHALSITSDIKSHIEYAVEHSDDSLFQKEKTDLFAEYEIFYEELTYASQAIQTFWRNA